MSAFDETSDRHVIPTWFDSAQALQSPELKRLNVVPDEKFELETPQKLEEFNRSPSSENALDLVNVASREQHDLDLSSAARLIIQDEHMPVTVRRLAAQMLDKTDHERAVLNDTAAIQRLRFRLKQSTSNPLAWADLARLYASRGDNNKAEKAMLVAVDLAGGNRWITRCASRLFVHLGKPDKAIDLILRNPMIKSDPWLMAANVSVSQVAEVRPSYWKEAKKLLDARVAPVHLGELSSAIATAELVAGQIKIAKKLLQKSLIEPTGNVLAQAQWAKRAKHVSNLDLSAINTVDDASEAKYWAAYSAGDLQLALKYAKEWLTDEPYSSRPAIDGCFVCSLLDDYTTMEEILRIGLRANADNQTLKINRAFCIFASNDLNIFDRFKVTRELVLRDLITAQRSDDLQTVAHAEATIGLAYYRSGDLHKGKEFYDNAEKIFRQLNIKGSALICIQNHLREAILARASGVAELVSRMANLLKEKDALSTPGMIFYASKLEKAAQIPDDAMALFRQPTNNSNSPIISQKNELFAHDFFRIDTFSSSLLPHSILLK
jgi:tetratricopeptide (TPR) repeat protein